MALAKQDKLAEAVMCYEEALRIKPDHAEALATSGLLDLEFISRNDESFEINTPELTVKELKLLENYVPKKRRKRPKEFEIGTAEFNQYCTTYRYYPLYAEFEL